MRLSHPTTAHHGAQFSAIRFDAAMFGREGSPWFALDHFRMTGPTFPPHPHSGFSAVTYILPRSASAMRNQDSLGDHTLIDPGGLHWTAAGGGIIHEEIPALRGQICEGFQMFVRQPSEQELDAPVIHHRDARDIPEWSPLEGVALRLLAGQMDGHDTGFAPPTPLVLIDATLESGVTWAVPRHAHWGVCLYLFDGRITIAGQIYTAPLLIATSDPVMLTAQGDTAARVLIMTGQPIDAPLVTHGPFALSSAQAIDSAVRRYQSGAMGHLAPMA